MVEAPAARVDSRRIVIIGPCASGKTTLAVELRIAGFDARVCGQEHSDIADLWRHLDPDVLIGLHVDLDTLRGRRSSNWPASIYARQIERLRDGFRHADLVVDTRAYDAREVAARVTGWLRRTLPT